MNQAGPTIFYHVRYKGQLDVTLNFHFQSNEKKTFSKVNWNKVKEN